MTLRTNRPCSQDKVIQVSSGSDSEDDDDALNGTGTPTAWIRGARTPGARTRFECPTTGSGKKIDGKGPRGRVTRRNAGHAAPKDSARLSDPSGDPVGVEPAGLDPDDVVPVKDWVVPDYMLANKELFDKVSTLFNAGTKNLGGNGGLGMGMPGTLVCGGAFKVLTRLLAVQPLADANGDIPDPVLLDCGVADGRMLLLAACLVPRIRLLGVEIDANSMQKGAQLCSPSRNENYKKQIISKYGGQDPLGNKHVEWFWGVFEPMQAVRNKHWGKYPPPRVLNLSGITHLMAMWQGWTPLDKRELLRLVREAPSIVSMCFVQSASGFLDLAHETKGWAKVTGSASVQMVAAGTRLTAYWLQKTATMSRPGRGHAVVRHCDIDPRSIMLWDEHTQVVHTQKRQTRSATEAMAQHNR